MDFQDSRVPAAAAASRGAKACIYQDTADRPITPVRKGTKGPPGGLQQQARPFAVAEVPGDVYPTDFHMDFHLKKNKSITGKAGADGYDANVYLMNRQENVRSMAESKMRNYAGGGTPYATQDVDQRAAYEREFHLQAPNKELPDKIGAAATFDAEVYRQSLAEHMQQQQDSRAKNRGTGTGSASGSSCPFATSDSEDFRQQWHRVDYHAKGAGKAMADKVGYERTFDAAVYSQAIENNRQHQVDSMQRNFVGGGDILAFHAGGGPASE